MINFHYKIATASFDGEDATPPTTGNWIIDSPNNVIINETITLNGNLIIKSGGSLTFKNVTLMMNCTTNGTFNIKVRAGGEFLIYDYDDNPKSTVDSSIITSAIPDGCHRYYFYVYKNARFMMLNSELHECGYYLPEGATPYYMQGLYIEAENTLIENCVISYNLKGILLYYYSNQSRIINTIISHNMENGLTIMGSIYDYINDIDVESCIITSNGQFGDGNIGIFCGLINNLSINNCDIFHNPKGISIGDTNNTHIINSNIMNNHYGLFDSAKNSNLVIENNSFVGNLEYSVYSYYDTPLKVQHNYFGTNNSDQIKASIYGNYVDYSNWLNYRESNILFVNNTENWNNDLKYLNNGLIINGVLTVENSNIILNNTFGKNFININGRLILKNSTVRLNKSNTKIISIWGGYSIIYSYNSSGEFINSTIQEQKGICINSNNFQVSNLTIIGNFTKYKPKYGLLIQGMNNTFEKCNISDVVLGIQIKSKNNEIKNTILFSNSYAINIIGDQNKLHNNRITQNGLGIKIDGNYNNIFNNEIIDNGMGIWNSAGNFNCISYCNISYNEYNGLYFTSGTNNTIINCTISKISVIGFFDA